MRQELLIGFVFVWCCSGCAQSYFNAATRQQETLFYSEEKEVALGRKIAWEIEAILPRDTDLLIQQHIQSIGQTLAAVSERRAITYTFAVLDKDEVNAFALPGGFIYMFRGLYDKIRDNDDAIAAVLAHEMAHVTARHSMKRLQNSYAYTALMVLVATAPGYAEDRARAVNGVYEMMLSYSREDEAQADEIALRYLTAAGFEPAAMITVLGLLEQHSREQKSAGRPARTHPMITERRGAVNAEIGRGNRRFDDYINQGIPAGSPM